MGCHGVGPTGVAPQGGVTPTEVEPLPPVSPRSPPKPMRSVSSLSDDAVVASEPNAEPEEESFELTFPVGPLGLGVSVMRDRKSGKAHVIVDSVLESCPHSKTLEKMDEITSIAG